MKYLKNKFALLLGTLSAFIDRRFAPSSAVPLPNSLGLINDNGIESLLIDPNSSNVPFPGRYLLVKRGPTGIQYGDLCNGGPGGPMPLGPSADSPYQSGDVLNVRRLGNRKGLELGIGIAGQAVTVDHLLASVAGGCVQDATTIATSGTYWIVGRAAATVPSNSSLMEVPYVPCVPYQLVNTTGTWTNVTNPA